MALSFLHGPFKPHFYWWELLLVSQKLIVVGFFVLDPFQPGSFVQLLLALGVVLIFTAVQIQAQPYLRSRDNILATTCAISICGFFLGAVLYRFHELTSDYDAVGAQLTSTWVSKRFTFSFEFISVLLVVSVLGSLVMMILLECAELVLPSTDNFYRRLKYLEKSREVHAPQDFMQSASRLEDMINDGLYLKDLSGNAVARAAPLPTVGPFHVFLSHSV